MGVTVSVTRALEWVRGFAVGVTHVLEWVRGWGFTVSVRYCVKVRFRRDDACPRHLRRRVEQGDEHFGAS